MWFRSLISIFLIVLSNHGFAINCESLILDDFKFQFQGKEIIASLIDTTISKSSLVVTFIKNENKSNLFSGTIHVKDLEIVCNKLNVEIDPVKLCRDVNGQIEPWKFVTYGTTDVVSVVSLTAQVVDPVLLFNSSICRKTQLTGRVFVQDSYLNGGGVNGLENSDTDPGTPDFPPAPDLPEIPLPEDDKKNTKEINFNFYTVKLVNVHINDGEPTITGEERGITIEDSIIDGSPVILKEISIKNSLITGNGFYEGEGEFWGAGPTSDYFIPIIRSNLTGDNIISGIFFLQREIENSFIDGEVSRKPDGSLDMVAHIGEHSTSFDTSEFYGFGHIGAEIRKNTFIYGYSVGPVSHGVLFESGLAYNYANIEGAVYAEELTLNDAEVKGNVSGPTEDDSYQIYDTTIITSEVYGLGYIYNSYIYMSDVKSTGSRAPLIRNSQISLSRVFCDAKVINLTLYNDTVDCDFPPPVLPTKRPKNKPQKLVQKIMHEFKRESALFKSESIMLEKKAKALATLKIKMRNRE